MLRIVQSISAAGAKSYYSTADYYTEGQELEGVWRGEGAARLGLSGKVEQPAWDALCDNRDPRTLLPLTVRRKQERSVGYDFNFHVPKSVSLLYGITRDHRILDAFRTSVNQTMHDMEAEMKTRVRKNGKNEDRTTGNMVWGEFIHFTSRPVGGVPDPHLHAHCFVHNVTFDAAEDRWKAGQYRDIKRDAPYFEAVFHSRLARRIEELGVAVERTQKGWEIAGLSKATLNRFSRRTAQIEETAKEQGITDAETKSELGAKTRERKAKSLTMDELRHEWLSRLSDDERAGVNRLERSVGGRSLAENPAIAQEAAHLATDHCFERKSVVPERELLAEALRRGVGKASAKAVEQAVSQRELIRAERQGRRYVTTNEVLAEERRMLNFARQGRGTRPRLGRGAHNFKRSWLNDGQRRAVLHVLSSADRVILVRGAAGTGKTSMMQEAVEAIEAGGTKVLTVAPSANASRGVLASEGFTNADTVARLLIDKELQQQAAGGVIWVDEAGLLGARTTAQLFDLAEAIDARLILSGDRRQHGSVDRGAALRLLETEAGLVPAEIRDIQRQKGQYKQAVQALSDGQSEAGFDQLDKLGWIKEVGDTDRYKLLAADYCDSVARGKTALVVSPTHREGEWITGEIRERLKELGRLKGEERIVSVLQSGNLTRAQRADATNYLPADVVEFHQNAKRHKKGQRLVAGIDPLPLDQAERFQVYRAATLEVAGGDVLRITQNGKTADGRHRLNNGALYTVKDFDAQGNIRLTNGWTVAKDFGHLAHGYAVTSHSSQGKTVDRVLIGQSSESFVASSREQFYVSVSRAREQVTIYTNDKRQLREAVRTSDERLSATEFVSERDRALAIQRMTRDRELLPEPIQPDRSREGIMYER